MPKVLRFLEQPSSIGRISQHTASAQTPPKMHCTSRSLLSGLVNTAAQRTSALPPTFLLPAFITNQTSAFSTTAPNAARKDGNPTRGASAIYRRQPHGRSRLSVKLSNLPKPVLDPARRSKVEVDEDHGLWGFFNADRSSLMNPDDYHAHGRGWTVQELRVKSWDDLHKLWWLCVKEINMIKTYECERERLKAGYGEYEAEERVKAVSLEIHWQRLR